MNDLLFNRKPPDEKRLAAMRQYLLKAHKVVTGDTGAGSVSTPTGYWYLVTELEQAYTDHVDVIPPNGFQPGKFVLFVLREARMVWNDRQLPLTFRDTGDELAFDIAMNGTLRAYSTAGIGFVLSMVTTYTDAQ